MQRLEVSGAVRPIYVSLGVKRLKYNMYKSKQHQSKKVLYTVSSTFPHT